MAEHAKSQEQVLLVGLDENSIGALRNTAARYPLSDCGINNIQEFFGSALDQSCSLFANSCAAVFVVSPEALDSKEFRHCIEQAVTEVRQRIDFRLLILLQRIDRDMFFHTEGSGAKTVKIIMRNVHVTGLQDPEDVMRELVNYSRTLPSRRNIYSARLRNLRIKTGIFHTSQWLNRALIFGLFIALAFSPGPLFREGYHLRQALVVMLLMGLGVAKAMPAVLSRITWGRGAYWNSILEFRFWWSVATLVIACWLSFHNSAYFG